METETPSRPTPDLTDDQIRALIEVEQVVTMWGQAHTITPRFVAERMGDGLQWIWLSPIMQRPNYWVIRVDSGWDREEAFAEKVDGVAVDDHLEEILQMIESEYGASEEEQNSEDAPVFPNVQIDGGSEWGRYDFDRKMNR